jgi:mono/diheme cytochrome c family protein
MQTANMTNTEESFVPHTGWRYGGAPFRLVAVVTVTVLVLSLGVAGWWYWKAGSAPPAPATPESTIDELLGQHRRKQFQQALQTRQYGGRKWNWDDFVRWGRELVHTAQVQNPPVGPAPSVPLADTYRCIHCHNLVREDPVLTRQDPEAREPLLSHHPANAGKKSGAHSSSPAPDDSSAEVALRPGTTFWGMVNRERFYNGYYARYHRLKVRDGEQLRPMNPASLSDAVQVCCSYCSAGRFPEDWELDSILAYLWTLELRLKDLQLPAELQQRLLEQLNSGQAEQINAARQELRRHYLIAAGATAVEPPIRSEDNKDIYPPSVAALEQLFRPGGSPSPIEKDQPVAPATKPNTPSPPAKSGPASSPEHASAGKAADTTSNRKNLEIVGDPKRGEWLYRSACANCHGNNVHPKSGRSLGVSPGTFHRYVWKGTERDGLYMPLFTRERLSPRQATDIRAYLRSLPR